MADLSRRVQALPPAMTKEELSHYYHLLKTTLPPVKTRRQEYYVVLTGAKKNVGDYLITQRAIDLLESIRPDREIIVLPAWTQLLDLDLVNNSRGVIIPGGPGYRKDFYPRVYPLTDNLAKIHVPIMPLGLGTNYRRIEATQISFEESSLPLVRKMTAESPYLGCRGMNAVRLLEANGVRNARLVGCPALHNKSLARTEMETFGSIDHLRTVTVSLPANPVNTEECLRLLHWLRQHLPKTRIVCTFHRGGMPKDSYSLKGEYEFEQDFRSKSAALDVELEDLSYNLGRMKVYDTSDLHIGYRLHAHIYFLSLFKPSILLNEDGRGEEIQEVLNLDSVDAGTLNIDSIEHRIERATLAKFGALQHVPNRILRLRGEIGSLIECLP